VSSLRHDLTSEMVPVGDLVPWSRNPRDNDAAADRLAYTIQTHGWTTPILAQSKTKRIIGGHTRMKAALKLGLTEVPVVWLDVDDRQADAIAIADNRLGELAEWDGDELAALLRELEADGADMAAIGFDESELAEVLAGLEPDEDLPDDGEVTEPPEEPDSRLGEVYELGPHRLVCGDAFDVGAQAIAGLSGADTVYSDPPYGMALDPRYDSMHTSKDHHATGDRFSAVIGDDVAFDAAPLVEAASHCREQFWWGADYYRRTIPDGGSWVVWDKRSNESGMDLDGVIGGMFELAWSRQKHRREIARVLWSGHHGMQREDTKSRVHPTQKPTGLAEWFAERWIEDGAVVFDFFGGSGSTLIACARTGRVARLIELDPGFCDVIRRRWTTWADAAGVDAGPGALRG